MVEQKKNVAQETIWPNSNILVRTVFLHVGQGSSSVVFIANGNSYLVLLVDTNKDAKSGGINVPLMMQDLLNGSSLFAFVNTHPHDDHICDVAELSAAISIDRVWHSDHKPSKKHGSKFKDLTDLIAKVKKARGEGAILVLNGSRTAVALGEAQYHVLAPAEHVTDDVNEEEADIRYRRIHEQCAVIKFGDGKNWHMNPGDADWVAFSNHITKYHKERLGAYVLAASHHGSRTFFRETEDDDPYMDGLNAINPTYVVVSAPAQEDSRFEHPHDDAMVLYENKVGASKLFHTGKDKSSYFFDIYKDGTVSGPLYDAGKLAKHYGHTEDGDDEPAIGGYTTRTEQSSFGKPERFA